MAQSTVYRILTASILLVAATACGPNDGGETGMGPIKTYLHSGRFGSWLAETGKTNLQLTNMDAPDAVRYYYITPEDSRNSKRQIEVDVEMGATHPGSSAGLIYRRSQGGKRYHLFLLEPGHKEVVAQFGEGGFKSPIVYRDETDNANLVHLEIKEDGRKAAFFVDGHRIASETYSSPDSGGVGIIAHGIGHFTFANFRYLPRPDINPNRPRAASPGKTEQQPPPAASPEASGPRQLEPAAFRTIAGSTPNVLRLKRFEIIDRSGFGHRVVATTILAPANWHLEGGVVWNPHWRCMSNMVQTHAQLVSPDGHTGFVFLPNYSAQWQDDPYGRRLMAQALAHGGVGCPLEAPFSATQFLERKVVPTIWPGARLVNTVPAPNVARAFEAKIERQLGSMLRGRAEYRSGAARVLARKGNQEEWITATVGVLRTRVPSPSAMMRGTMVQQNSYLETVQDVFGFFAPVGAMQSDAPLMQVMIGSIRANPQWSRAIEQTEVNIGRMIEIGVHNRSAIISRAEDEISHTQMSAWNVNQAVQDRVMTKWSQTIRGTATFINPEQGTQVELPDYYDSVWSDGNGEYLLVRGHDINPNEHFQGDWTRLQKRQ